MRKALLPALALLVVLCACGETESRVATPADDVTAEQVAQAVLDSQVGGEGLTALPAEEAGDYLLTACGLEEALWTQAAVYLASGVDARVVIVLRLGQEGDADAAAQALEDYRQARLGDFYGYAPDQAALVEEGAVLTAGDCAALLICEDLQAARTAFYTALGLEGEQDGTSQPSPSPQSTLDVSAFEPFDPPGEFDMTLYDTSAILAAWDSGEESALSREDAAILARCREMFDQYITDDMTEFEKELALHDALLRQGSYDETVYDPSTPQGRPHSSDPYGMLVEGYGICLGYATSFQLLMDLAGVECITVVGASSRSTSDHAWNMVCLEGEWYCVDPTWNDPAVWEDVPEPDWDWCHHRYFNVTSDYMRQTDHQWDYENVPEATGERFFWDAIVPLPQSSNTLSGKEVPYARHLRYGPGPQAQGAARPGHPAHHRQGEGVYL